MFAFLQHVLSLVMKCDLLCNIVLGVFFGFVMLCSRIFILQYLHPTLRHVLSCCHVTNCLFCEHLCVHSPSPSLDAELCTYSSANPNLYNNQKMIGSMVSATTDQ